jgi:hypothetical protein
VVLPNPRLEPVRRYRVNRRTVYWISRVGAAAATLALAAEAQSVMPTGFLL